MKILICSQEYPPEYSSGIGNVAYNIVEQLKKKGNECVVCSPTGPDIKLGSSKLIEKFGIAGLLYYWFQVSNYFKADSLDFDLVWLHNPLFLIKNPFKNSLVTIHTTYHGKANTLPYRKSYYQIAAKIEKYCLNKISDEMKFYAVSPVVCNELEAIGIKKEKITYIPNGVDIEQFKPLKNKNILREYFGFSKDDVIILSVGRLTEAKQPQKLIKVFSLIEKEMKDIILVIAGDGELLGSVKNLVKNKKLERVKILGYVSQINKQNLYVCSDFYIMASNYEGQPLTLLEAMAAGLPCIVSNIPTLRIVEEVNCGIVVDYSDIGKAALRIIDYVNQDTSEHGGNAREYAEEHLDWRIIAEKYHELFRQIK
jgi:1,2-diacylglycerol 3-alpha-glucosyltransferase